MSDQMTEVPDIAPDVDLLIDEIRRLRGQVAQLEARVEQLDELAHPDTLINLPNRRGFMRALERFAHCPALAQWIRAASFRGGIFARQSGLGRGY
jgi:hypothetical protein